MIFDAKHEMIRKLVRQFAETELTTEVLDKVEETGEFPEEIVEKMAKCGFLGLKIPREYGGAGADTLAYIIMIEEIARVSAVASLYANTPNSLGGGPLMQAGTPEQLEKYLRPSVENKVKIVFGLTEPGAGSDSASMVTTAVKDGDYYILNGRKCFISGAPLADYCIVYAKTDMSRGNKGISAFIVDMKAPGVSCGKHEAKMGLVGYATSDVVLEDVRVHKSDMLGKENMGFINAMKTLDGGRLGVSAQSIGLAQGCLDEAIKYSKERIQFGKPICKNQAIAFMLADMATKLTAAKELDFKRVWAVFQPFTFSRTYMLLEDFVSALSIADRVVLSPIMGSREVNTYHITSEDLGEKIPGCVCLPSFQAMADYVDRYSESGDLILTLGCGDVYKCARMILYHE